MNAPSRICIIAPGHLSSSPRVVKEADALHAAGFDVTVVSTDHFAPVREFDSAILAKAAWRSVLLRPPVSRLVRLAAKLRRGASRTLVRLGVTNLNVAIHANDERHGGFLAAALAVPADLYIGHTLSGLAVAARAAKLRGVILGFDAEDWHREEQTEADRPSGLTRAIGIVEDALVRRCAYVTAASPLIGAAYGRLGPRVPVTILNVFPIRDSPDRQVALSGALNAVYWFSQTVGPGRGIEAILRGVALLPKDWEFHLRGTPAPGYPESLGLEAASLGLAGRLKWLPRAPADQMVPLASPFAAGLSVELTVPRNRGMCLTNKVFTYVLAGAPVLLSDTPAHRLLAPDLGDAARLVAIDQPQAVADAILALHSEVSRNRAWLLGRERYNWEFESRALVDVVRQALG